MFIFSVPYYTVVTFETSWSFLVGFLRAHIIVKLYGDAGNSESVGLKRYLNVLYFKNFLLILDQNKATQIFLIIDKVQH